MFIKFAILRAHTQIEYNRTDLRKLRGTSNLGEACKAELLNRCYVWVSEAKVCKTTPTE